MYVAKTKMLFSFAVIAQLSCAFVLAYVKKAGSHDSVHLKVWTAYQIAAS